MSRRSALPKKKKQQRAESETSEDEPDASRLPYFVPEDGIDIEPLAAYVRGLLDRKARVSIGSHPSRREQTGFWVESAVAIGLEDVRAMVEDTRLWRKENADVHYVNSATMKRRMKIGRPEAAKTRPIAAMKSNKDTEDPRAARQGSIAQSIESDPRFISPQPITRASADTVPILTSQRNPAATATAPSPRPASAQPYQTTDPRRPSNIQQYQSNINPAYVQTTAQYPTSTNAPQAQYSNYEMYDAPAQYQTESKRAGGGTQPSTTGTHGFQSTYPTAGGPPRPNQGQRRHGA